jgi:putative transposase
MLKRERIIMNHKRLRRIYREECLQVRPRKKRRVRLVRGNWAPAPTRLNEAWELDFMEDTLLTRRKVRIATIEDRHSREGLAVDPDFSLTSRRVIRTLDDIAAVRGYPSRLRVDNGPEN